MNARTTPTVLIIACAVVSLAMAVALSLDASARTGGSSALAGGGSTNPAPPTSSVVPPPNIGTSLNPPGGPTGGPVLVQVLAPARRDIVVRRLDGRVVHVAATDDRGRLVLTLPAGIMLIDVVGSDAVGIPISPWQRVTVAVE